MTTSSESTMDGRKLGKKLQKHHIINNLTQTSVCKWPYTEIPLRHQIIYCQKAFVWEMVQICEALWGVVVERRCSVHSV